MRPRWIVIRSVRGPHFDAEVNVLGTSGLLQNCVEHGLGKVVFASTGGAVNGEQREFLTTEDHPQYLLSCYEFSKLAAELYLYY
jgi:UDP-glucose 4-epimerase